MPRRPSLAFVIRFLSIRISTADRLTVSNGLLEVHIYLSHFGTYVLYYFRSSVCNSKHSAPAAQLHVST
jgi:hypothetical protein